MRIYRHDLRHKLRTAAMVEKGAHNDALNQLIFTQQDLEKITVTRYCSDSVLGGMFSDYYQRAKAAEVQVDSYLSLPEELPEGHRRIHCKCLSISQLMLRNSRLRFLRLMPIRSLISTRNKHQGR